MRPYTALKALQAGETLVVGGVTVRMTAGELKPGCKYVAERNTGPQLLTLDYIHRDDRWAPWAVPVESGTYCYDLGECIRVEIVENS